MKRLLSFLLVTVMLLSLVPINAITAFATGEANATINVESTSAAADSYVDVAIEITENPGIASMGLTLSFDEDLILVGATNGEAFSDLKMTPPAQLKNTGSVTGSCRFAWLGSENCTEVGTMLNLRFLVSETATLYKNCYVTVSFETGDVLDESRNPIEMTANSGKITIIDYVPGDVDGNGTITMFDVLTLCQYYVDGCKYDPDGYAVNIKAESGDVDANGKINMLDILTICQYYVDGCKYDPNGYGVKLLPGKRVCEHDMEHIAAKAASCTENGNIEYWHCSLCNEYFADADGKDVISLDYTVIQATGHTVIVDEAKAPTYTETGLTEGSHCSVCHTILQEQKIVPILQKTEYAITYSNTKGAENTNPTSYFSEDGLASFESLSIPGYNFTGWYDSNGNKITSIPVNHKENLSLTAGWELIQYKITYDLANATNSANNVDEGADYKTYTVESNTFTLAEPNYPGYIFAGWRIVNDDDTEGDLITKITKGSVGDVHLRPEWKSLKPEKVAYEQIKNPKYERVIRSKNPEEPDAYYFTYYLGYIRDVPLGDLSDKCFVDYRTPCNFELELKQNEKYTNSSSTYVHAIEKETQNWQASLGAELKAGVKIGIVSAEASIKGSYTWGNTDETLKETSSDIYTQSDISNSFELTYTLDPEYNLAGYYWYCPMGVVDVFAVVRYNATDNSIAYSTKRVWRDSYSSSLIYAKTREELENTNILGDFDFTLADEVLEEMKYLVVGTKDLVIKESGNACSIVAYTGTDTDVVIPSYFINEDCKALRVASFSSSAFKGNTNIRSITFGEHVSEIPDSAFEGCTALESVDISNSITKIGDKAFKDCISLQITIPENVIEIGDHAFEGCTALSEIAISDKVTALGENVFKDCTNLKLNAIPSNMAVAKNVASSCAKEVWMDMSALSDKEAIATIQVPKETFKFSLTGGNEVFDHLRVEISSPISTSIDQITIESLKTVSETILLNAVTINADQKTALELTAEQAELLIRGTVELTSNGGSATALIAKNVNIHPYNSLAAAVLNVKGSDGSEDYPQAGNGITASGNVIVSGYFELTAVGGDGGIDCNGGDGICAENLTVLSGNLEIKGGKGGTGSNGADGADGTAGTDSQNGKNNATPGTDGIDGKDGKDGAVGGDALHILNTLTIESGVVMLENGEGGNGGNGGNGGKGGNGGNGPYKDASVDNGAAGGDGGNGGNGGDGGKFGYCIKATTIDVSRNTSLTFVFNFYGNGGSGGNGGEGGQGGSAGSKDFLGANTGSGYGGTGGNGGNGGTGGKSYIFEAIPMNTMISNISTDQYVIYNQSTLKTGKGGNGGAGGNGGTTGRYNTWGGSDKVGKGGNGGNAGGCGELVISDYCQNNCIFNFEDLMACYSSTGNVGARGLSGYYTPSIRGNKYGEYGLAADVSSVSYPFSSKTYTPGGLAKTTYNGHTYVLYAGKYSWTDAKAMAETYGGHLVTITSSEENDIVAELFTKTAAFYDGIEYRAWIGLIEKDSGENCTWVTGEDFSFSYWNSGEPNDSNGVAEDYVAFSKNANNKWGDFILTSNVQGFIVEYEYLIP